MAFGVFDSLLIFVVVVVAIFVLFACLLLVIKFQHPDDTLSGWLPKTIIISGLWLAFAIVLIMPYDVANGASGALDIDILWYIAFLSAAAFIVVIIPFAFFYYESESRHDKDTYCGTSCRAIQYTLAFIVIFTILSVCLYATPANTAEIPVNRIPLSWSAITRICTASTYNPGSTTAWSDRTYVPFTNPSLTNCGANNGCVSSGDFIWSISVTYPIYVLCLLSFLGWFFFLIFAGVGLVSLPVDFIMDWVHRPTPLEPIEYAEQKAVIIGRIDGLLKAGNSMLNEEEQGNGGTSESSRAILKLEREFYIVRQDHELLELRNDFKNHSPLWYIFKLIMGILFTILSICWITHISLYVLPGRGNQIDPFLNTLFIDLTNLVGFPLFGIICYATFVFYLQWCVVAGNFKMGIRFLCFQMYPMELGRTYLSAFLANVWVILLCSFPLVQFTASAFTAYSRQTAVDMIFGTQIRYLRGFGEFWQNNIFVYALLGFSCLTLPYVLCCPNGDDDVLEQQLNSKKEEKTKRII